MSGGRWIGAALLAWLTLLAGCSSKPSERTPTEQELHTADTDRPGGIRGRHHFTCDDGGSLLVDFKDQGLGLEIREREGDKPIVLTAPAQGLQYVGDNAAGTIGGGQLRLYISSRPERVCTRLTK